jgi:hypothetical protein
MRPDDPPEDPAPPESAPPPSEPAPEAAPAPAPEEKPAPDPEEQLGVRGTRRYADYVSFVVKALTIDARSGGVYFEGGSPEVAGGVVGGHGSTEPAGGPFDARTATRPVDAQVLAELEAVYTPPPIWDDATKKLADRRIVILRGQRGWGKATTGLRLLSKAKASSIMAIDPGIGVGPLHSYEPGERHGYLVDTLGASAAERLSPFRLERLADRLRRQESFLVITVDSAVVVPGEGLRDYLVDCGEQPDRRLVLERHLALHPVSVEVATRLEELLNSAEARRLLEVEPLVRFRPLAEELVAVAKGDRTLDALSTYRATRAREQAESWFETHSDPRDATFMIAVALLNGGKYQDVADAARDLYERVAPLDEEGRSAEARRAFGLTRRNRVKEVCARLVAVHEATEIGRSPVEVVQLDNKDLQFEVLRYVWQEFDDARRPLLEWLHDLGRHPNEDIRYMAAGAVGGLSTYDFEYVLREVLLRWAQHDDWRCRTSAAVAFGAPAQVPESSGLVLELLREWSGQRQDEDEKRWTEAQPLTTRQLKLLWTTAVAYGRPVGEHFPKVALDGLLAITRIARFRLFWTVSESLLNLFDTGADKPDFHREVLSALLTWIDDDTLLPPEIARQAFLALSEVPRIELDDGSECPTILSLVPANSGCRQEVLSLWREVLNARAYRSEGLRVLDQWLASVDEDDRLLPLLEEFLRALIAGRPEREQERIHYWLRQRAEHPRASSPTATKLYRQL